MFGLNTGKYGPEKTPYLDTFTQCIVKLIIENSKYNNKYFQNKEIAIVIKLKISSRQKAGKIKTLGNKDINNYEFFNRFFKVLKEKE